MSYLVHLRSYVLLMKYSQFRWKCRHMWLHISVYRNAVDERWVWLTLLDEQVPQRLSLLFAWYPIIFRNSCACRLWVSSLILIPNYAQGECAETEQPSLRVSHHMRVTLDLQAFPVLLSCDNGLLVRPRNWKFETRLGTPAWTRGTEPPLN